MTHDATNSVFTIPQMPDRSNVGKYTFTIRGEINVPNDHTMTASTIISHDEVVIVKILPCPVDAYTASTASGSMIYKIGELAMTRQYSFDESPFACDYVETLTVTNLPAFMTHDEGLGEFTILETNDYSLVGLYTVTVLSEIQVPSNAEQTVFTTKFDTFEITIEVQCSITSFTDTVRVQTLNYILGDPTKTYDANTYAF